MRKLLASLTVAAALLAGASQAKASDLTTYSVPVGVAVGVAVSVGIAAPAGAGAAFSVPAFVIGSVIDDINHGGLHHQYVETTPQVFVAEAHDVSNGLVPVFTAQASDVAGERRAQLTTDYLASIADHPSMALASAQ